MTHNAVFEKGLGNCCQLESCARDSRAISLQPAAVTSTTERLLMADAVLGVAFGVSFNHFVELQ